MRTLSDIVRGRLKAKGWTQERLAEFLEISTTFLSDILNGRRAPATEAIADWSRWADGLDLTGPEADELGDALHLAAAVYYGPRVGVILERLEAETARAKAFEEECRHRLRRARHALDLMDPPEVIRGRATEPRALDYDDDADQVDQPPEPPTILS